MKRFINIILNVFLISAFFTGCLPNERGQSDKINIVCTIFPQYDWIRQIIGEENMNHFELTLLIDSLVDLHSYNPSVHDIAKISTADIFIYVGGASDEWAEAVIKQAVNTDIAAVNLMEILGNRVIYDGYDHDEEECEEDHDHNEIHEDEHIWLSLFNARMLCGAIAVIVADADRNNAAAYTSNAYEYITKLTALEADYQTAAASANTTALLFADRFPFRYLAEDLGLSYYAAFNGCSAETEASFATIISLANRVNQLGLNAVMVTESSDQSIAKTVINNTNNKNPKILVLDSMQSVTANDIKNGTTYLSIMENNLSVLKEALQ